MSSYGYSTVFIGWHKRVPVESALSTLLGRPTVLPRLDEGDWMEDYDEPPELEGIHRQLKAWHRAHKKLPKPMLEVLSPGLDQDSVYLLRLKVPLNIQSGSDGPSDLELATLSLKHLDKSIAAAEQLAAQVGITPSMLHLSSDDPK